MTIRDLFAAGDAHATWLLLALAAPPLAAALLSLGPKARDPSVAPSRWAYAALVYLACVPGVAAATYCAYAILIAHENLLDMGVATTLAPIAAMGLTLGLVGRQVSFVDLPGFGRLSGLVLMLAMTFAAVLAIEKTRILVMFHGSFMHLLLVGVMIFLGFRVGAKMLFGGRSEPVR